MTIKSNSPEGQKLIEKQKAAQEARRFKTFKDEVKEMSFKEMGIKQEELSNRISKLHEYKEFIATLSEAQVGDEIKSQGSLIEVVKRTPQGHLDFNIYEIDVDEKNGEETRGKWKGKNRFTQKDLENSIAVAVREEAICIKENRILEDSMRDRIESGETEDSE